MFNKVQAVELALCNLLIEAIDPVYFTPFRNNTTDMIVQPIPNIIDWLSTTYGILTEGQLFDKGQNLSGLTYDALQPVDFVFQEINKFADLSKLSQLPISDRRMCQFAYVIFQKSCAFLDSLKKWNERAAGTKSYTNMKTFMRDKRASLEKVGALTIQDSLNQAELLKSIQQQQETLTQ